MDTWIVQKGEDEGVEFLSCMWFWYSGTIPSPFYSFSTQQKLQATSCVFQGQGDQDVGYQIVRKISAHENRINHTFTDIYIKNNITELG